MKSRGDQVNRMLRVTVVESSRSAVTLRVEGRMTGSFVEELRKACDVHTLPDAVQLSLDLADVSFADAAGIVLLKELRSRGVGLMRTSPFMAEQLKDGTSSDVSRVT
jgi:ABC-type transporter Mla MlaB component